MPQKDMSGKLGKSSSPSINRVIEKNKGVQKCGSVPGILKSAHNKQTVKVG